MTGAESFMQRYTRVWPSFDDRRVLEVVHPDAAIHHSGMESPISGEEEGGYVRAIKALIPDIQLRVLDWAAREETVFVEYEMAGSVVGRRLRWVGIGRFKLRGDRAVDAIGRWDNLDLLAQLDGSVRRTAFAEAASALLAERDAGAG
jgi:hypothetical protein